MNGRDAPDVIAPAQPQRPPSWEQLTRLAHKADLYRQEAQLWEAWTDVEAAWGPGAEELLSGLAVVVFKPESIVKGVASPGVDFLVSQGFVPVASAEVDLTRPIAHWIWRYQWNKATVDRVRLHQMVHEQTSSLMVVARDDRRRGLPASVRMWGLKGPTDAARRDRRHLRTAVGMVNRMIGFVHCPDEPADILRELGIVLGGPERARLLSDIARHRLDDRTAVVREHAARLEAGVERHGIDPREVAPRLAAAGGPRAELAGLWRDGVKTTLDDVLARFGQPRTPADQWDLYVLAAELIRHDRPGVRPIIDAASLDEVRAAWRGSSLGEPVRADMPGRTWTADPATSTRRARDVSSNGEGCMWGPNAIWIGVYDALSARLAHRTGAPGLWLSSYCVSAALKSRPDAEHVTATEVLGVARSIGMAVPGAGLVVDCDTGFGDADVFAEVVHAFAATTAAAGISIEDKQHPKRNSFYRQELQVLVDADAFAAKIAAGVRARRRFGPHLKIIARTEALVAGQPAAEAVRRLEIYRDAGADGVLVQARGRLDVLLETAQLWAESSPGCPLVCAPTAFPDLRPRDLWEAGFYVVIQANQLLRAAVRSQGLLVERLIDPSVPLGMVADDLVTMSQLDALVGAQGLSATSSHGSS